MLINYLHILKLYFHVCLGEHCEILMQCLYDTIAILRSRGEILMSPTPKLLSVRQTYRWQQAWGPQDRVSQQAAALEQLGVKGPMAASLCQAQDSSRQPSDYRRGVLAHRARHRPLFEPQWQGRGRVMGGATGQTAVQYRMMQNKKKSI